MIKKQAIPLYMFSFLDFTPKSKRLVFLPSLGQVNDPEPPRLIFELIGRKNVGSRAIFSKLSKLLYL
jgi:hypothetical protein